MLEIRDGRTTLPTVATLDEGATDLGTRCPVVVETVEDGAFSAWLKSAYWDVV